MATQVETSGIIRQERPYEPVRTKTCGELRLSDVGKDVTIAGWVSPTHLYPMRRENSLFCLL